MGDRANVCVRGGDIGEHPVYLYTHWGGYNLPNVVQKALGSTEGRQRWGDGSYLARIIFNHMEGRGIATTVIDNDHYPILVVDCTTQQVLYEDPNDHDPRRAPLGGPDQHWEIGLFVETHPEDLISLWKQG